VGEADFGRAIEMRRLLSCALLFASLAIVTAEDPVGICGLDGFDLTDLHFAQYWNFTVPEPTDNCLYDGDSALEVTGCTVFFSICKPLPKAICGEENVTYCQVVTLSDGTQQRFNMGNYTVQHKFNVLTNGFGSIRSGQKYENEKSCPNNTLSTYTYFECDSFAKFSVSQPNITDYISSVIRAECTTIFHISYSGACYQQPTLAPSHCSLPGFDTTAISKMDYFSATLNSGVCYGFDEDDSCLIMFAFCHPLPLDISDNCNNPESAVCQANKLVGADKAWSMGAYENYTRFYENVDIDLVGFHVIYTGGSNPEEPDCPNGMQTRVVFVCDKAAKWVNEDITYYIEVEKETCFFNIIAKYDGACYKAHDINGGTSTAQTSYVGWIFIGIFLFGVLTYLVVGSAVQYFVRQERGLRVLPNFDFWRNFILLTLEGCKYTMDRHMPPV
jgi:hypothetical protein